jgi:hypothetical protein
MKHMATPKTSKRKIYLATVAVLLVCMFLLSLFAALYILHRPASGSFESAQWVVDSAHFDGFSSVGTFIPVNDTLGNGFALTGSLANGSLTVLRTKSSLNGEPLWQKNYGAGSGNAILQASGGDFMIAATKFTFGGSQQTNSSWLIKTDSSGSLQWSREYAGNGFLGIAKAADGYVLLGQFDVNGTAYPGLLKVDLDGNVQWNTTYSSQAPVLKLSSLISTSDGGYGMVGEMQYTVNGVEMRNGWFVKTDALGNVQIDRPFVMKGWCVLNSLVESDEGFLLVGATAAGADYAYSACLIGTDVDGHSQWSRVDNALENSTGDGGGFEYYSAAKAENGTLFVAGYLSGVGTTVQLIDSTGDTEIYDTQTNVAKINYLTATSGGGYAYAGYRDGSIWLVHKYLSITVTVT